MTWQWFAVLLIEAFAIVFLARRMFGSQGSRPKKRGPDVPVRSLVRKKR